MKRFLLIMLTAALVMSLTACGGTEPPAAGGGGAEKIVCGVTIYDPMNFKDDDDNWTGFDTEFALLVGEALGLDVEFQQIEWINKYAELESGAITCIWNGFTANSFDEGTKRTELVDMSYGYMLNKQSVVVKVEDVGKFTSAEDLIGKTIAVENGSAGESTVLGVTEEDCTLIGAAAQINTFTEVKAGAVDCAVVDILLAESITGAGNYADLAIADVDLGSEVYAIGFQKDSPLKDQVNAVIKELFDDGTLLALAEKYGLENSLLLIEDIDAHFDSNL